MPTSRGALTAQFVDHTLYVIGGADQIIYSINESYDHASNTWKALTQMPTPRDHLTSAVVDGQIYMIGGRKGTLESNLGTNEAYDPESDSWTKLEQMPTPRGGLTASTANGTIFVFGGESTFGTFDKTERYIPQEGWIEHMPMKTSRHGLGSATVGDRIYVIGGGTSPGLSVSGITESYYNSNVIPEFPFMIFVLVTSFMVVIILQNYKFQFRF